MDKPLRGAKYLLEFHWNHVKIECMCMVNQITDHDMTLVSVDKLYKQICTTFWFEMNHSTVVPCLRLFLHSRMVFLYTLVGTRGVYWEHARNWSWNYSFREEAREAARIFLLCANRTKSYGDGIVRRRIALMIKETWRDPCWIRVHHKKKQREDRGL